ncbi:MAG: hypothetical protein AB7Q01_14970 [Gammaproteobacteria bacterium]
MTSRRIVLRHVFDGGWSPDLSPRTLAGPDASGLVRIPYLTTAENIVYELDGGPRKAPGTSKVNSSELESGAAIVGCYDCWFHGSSGTPAQHRILNIGEKIKADDADGVFADLFTGLNDSAIPTYTMLEDLLIIGLDGSDTIKSWDGSTAQALAGSPPNGAIVETHANRLWVTGVDSDPSGLYYSPLLDPENTSGTGWGRIGVDPSDGDRITAIKSYKGELIVFKGPYKGSIHRISGTAPTGADAFRKVPRWVEGIGAAWQNTLFRYGDDLGFMGFDGAIHSLKAVAAYGDFNEVALSRPIQSFLNRMNRSQLKIAWAASDVDTSGFVLFTVPIDGATENNAVFGMDYRFAGNGAPMRWFYWPAFEGISASVMSGIDASANNRRIYYFGGGDGYLRKGLQNNRSIDDTDAIRMLVASPYFDYGLPFNFKTAGGAYLQFAPKNNGNIDFIFKRDSNNQQTFEINQGAGDPLGTVTGMNFTLDISTLAEATVLERFIEADAVGEFRQIQYAFANDVLNEDVELHGFGLDMEAGSVSTEN